MVPVHRKKSPSEKASGCSRVVLVLIVLAVVLMVLLLRECARASAPERRAASGAGDQRTSALIPVEQDAPPAAIAKPASQLPAIVATPARPAPTFTCETFPLPPRVQSSGCAELVAGSNAYSMSAMGVGSTDRVFAWYRAKFSEFGIDLPLPASGEGAASGRMSTVSLPDFELVLSAEPAGQNQIRIIAAWRNGPPPTNQQEIDNLRRLTTNMLTTLHQTGKE